MEPEKGHHRFTSSAPFLDEEVHTPFGDGLVRQISHEHYTVRIGDEDVIVNRSECVTVTPPPPDELVCAQRKFFMSFLGKYLTTKKLPINEMLV